MLEGHILLQELVLLVVVVEDVESRHLVALGVDALVLILVDVIVVVVLELEQKRLDLLEDEGLAHRLALVNACHVVGCEMHDGLDARLVEECSMTMYLSRRRLLEPEKVSSECRLERLRLEYEEVEGGRFTNKAWILSILASFSCL